MRLLIFTQKVDKNDSVLGFFHDWLIEFSKQCESVTVAAPYNGEYSLPENVKIIFLGKNNRRKGSKLSNYYYNIIAGFKFYYFIFKEMKNYDNVFVHMNHEYVLLGGIFWKIYNKPIYLWYVHRNVDLKLKIASFFCQKIFTSSKESFGIKTGKAVFLGHGINTDKFKFISRDFTKRPINIVHLGRITPIKNIDTLVLSISELKNKGIDIKLNIHGDCVYESDQIYKAKLESIISEKGLKKDVFFVGGYNHDNLEETLKEAYISVNLAPNGGMDKVVLESILLGIPAFASNVAFLDVFGDYKDMFSYNFKDYKGLAQKIESFLKRDDKEEIMMKLDKKVRENFSLTGLVNKMILIMKS